jgi:2-dehydropantoate 2-reductase
MQPTASDLSHLRIAVLGTGANGAGIGADLVDAGLDVTFIDQWPANVHAIREHGVRVELSGDVRAVHVPALHLCEVATLTEPFDVVLLLVKAYDSRWACELIKPHVAQDGVVAGVQNGMTGQDIVDVMGPDRAVAAVIEVTAAMYEPGYVERHSDRSRSWFAVGAPRPESRRHVPVVAALLRIAGIVEELDDITIRPIFGMTGEAAGDPATFMETILDELCANYVLSHSRSTILQDWMKHRHAEVDDINGLVVSGLARHGRTAPVNQVMVEMSAEIEAGTRERGRHNLIEMLERIEAYRG